MQLDVLFIGDIVGKAGRRAVACALPGLVSSQERLVVANGENSAAGFGLTKKIYKELKGIGIDVVTGGNHIWDKSEVEAEREYFPKLAVPANLPKGEDVQDCHPVVSVEVGGLPISIINLSGRVFMPKGAHDPFECFDRLYEHYKDRIIIVDFHSEATSEKLAFAHYVDGKVAAVVGTHTHVQTADERLLPKKTFYMSDAGSCSAYNSILGMTVESSLGRFLSKSSRMTVELDGPLMFNAVKFSIDKNTGYVTSFKRIYRVMRQNQASRPYKPE